MWDSKKMKSNHSIMITLFIYFCGFENGNPYKYIVLYT